MTRWTPTEPRALRQVDDVTDLRALIVAALDAIAGVLPMLDELTDTRQPGLGVTTRRTETIRSQHRARELAARYPTRRADGSLIAVGQRGLVRSDSVVTMPGTRPVPVNLSAVSIADEITMEVAHLCQRIRRRLIAAGVCHIKRPADNPTPRQVLAEARDLVPVVASRELLLDMARTLAGVEGLADRACTIALGPDRVDHPRPCPHCRHRSLVVHIEAGITRCEGTHRCVCRDSYCPCHRDRTHRHQWRRDAPTKDARKGWRGRRESWDGLTREQDLADREAAADPTTEGAPMSHTERVLSDVANERRRQVEKGYTPEHDDRHQVHGLVQLAEKRAHMEGAAGPGRYDRKHLVEATAILVAAIEVLDRWEAEQ